MNKSQRKLIALLLAAGLLASGCFKSKNVVEKVPPAGGNKPVKLDGVPYALPRTVIVATIPVKRTDKKPGAQEKFAPCFFPRNVAAGRVREKSREFSVETPTFATRGEPDPEARFIAKIKGGFFENKTMSLVFNPEGVITTGEASSTNEALPFLLKAARTAVSIGANIALPGAAAAAADNALAASEGFDREQLVVDICRVSVATDAAANAASKAAAAAEELNGETTCEDDTGRPCQLIKDARAEVEKAERAIDAARASVMGAERAFVQFQAERLAAERNSNAAPANAQPMKSLAGQAEAGVGLAIKHVNAAHSRLVELAKTISGTTCPAKQKCEAEQKACEAAKAAARQIEAALKFIGEAPCGGPGDELAGVNCKSLGTPATAPVGPTPGQTRECHEQQQKQKLAFANGYAEAKRAHDRIELLQSQLDSLTSGPGAPSGLAGDALKSMIETTRATIKAHQNAFLGTESEDVWSGKFDFTPATYRLPASANSMQWSPVLFTFSKQAGLCESPESRYQGVQIKEDFKAKQCGAAGMESVWLSVRRSSANDDFLGQMSDANARAERAGERGFYYRIPAKAVVKVERGVLTDAQLALLEGPNAVHRREGQQPQAAAQDETVSGNGEQGGDGQAGGEGRGKPDARQTAAAEKTTPPAGTEVGRETLTVAQLGVTASIPASAAGRTTQYTLAFDESTGALRNFRLASNALLEKSMLEDVEAAATDVIDANRARDKARDDKAAKAAAAEDELTRKKRELELLKTQNEINEERKKLENSGDEEESPPGP